MVGSFFWPKDCRLPYIKGAASPSLFLATCSAVKAKVFSFRGFMLNKSSSLFSFLTPSELSPPASRLNGLTFFSSSTAYDESHLSLVTYFGYCIPMEKPELATCC